MPKSWVKFKSVTLRMTNAEMEKLKDIQEHFQKDKTYQWERVGYSEAIRRLISDYKLKKRLTDLGS